MRPFGSLSFGPSVIHEADGTFRASCSYCTFLTTNRMCRYVPPVREVPDPQNTPDWCKMREGMLRDAKDMAEGVEHTVVRWSGRRTDDPRVVYKGIPSEAHRQFRLSARNVKRGTVRLLGERGEELARHPASVVAQAEAKP